MSSVITAKRPVSAWGASTAVEERFRPLIAELEALAAAKPHAYRGRVVRRAWLGYGYILLILTVLVALIAGLVLIMVAGHGFNALTVKLGFFLGAAAVTIVGALWVKMSPPEGLRVTAAQAPALFAMLEEVRVRTGGPRPHEVIVTPEFNAAIVQHPRLGLFGWHRNFVILGLPLLLALPRDEVMAVIGHEYGHLAGSHGKMAAWIYRVRMTWLRLSASLGTSAIGGIFQRFFKWYGPWFNAYSFVLARHNEYEADRAAADVGGAHVAARALTRVSVETHRYNRFWAELFDNAAVEADGPVFPHARLGAHFVQPMDPRDFTRALNVALGDVTGLGDTHPCLKDRLAALDQPLPRLEPVAVSGAEALLGHELLRELTAQIDSDWWRRAYGYWTQRRSEGLSAREALAQMEARAEGGDLDEDDDWELQRLYETCNEDARALDLARRRLTARPDDIHANLCLGRLLLGQGDPAGLLPLQKVLAVGGLRQPQLYALDHIVSYFAGFAPEHAERAAYQARFDAALDLYNRINAELDSLDPGIDLEPHGMPERAVAAVRGRAAGLAALGHVWIARRRLKVDAETTQYVMLYELGGDANGDTQAFVDDVLKMLSRHGNAFVVRAMPANAWLKSRLQAIDGARIVGR